ncbi:hypothetical protein B0T25DRAFT_270791 [Lasiosphaeria hispida]|uniref:Uncharacterized protein n=1 Tax=Lasiosphaeria hispida TaxID=260671 RepID=A0AAJ0HBI1_9PEZI|nr:hypothetical protein B0T25DRAFT_270791 [Lasiosphaeria hispida]
MHGEVCEVGDDCARSFNYQEGLSKTASNELSNTYGETETNSVTTKLGFSLGLKLPLGKFDILGGGMPLSTDLITGATPAGIPLGGPLRARALDLGMTLDISHAWSMAVNKGHTFGVGNSTQWSITIGVTENLSKPAYAKNYCGGWFGVPIMGLSCGRGAHGTLKQSSRDSYQCALEPGTATFGHCFDYTFIDPVKANQTRYRMVYVLRDCQHGYILPGEWQHPAFAQSFWAGDYVSEHIMRFGYQNLPATSKKPHDDSWIEQRHAFEFTRQLGPEDHTIEVCGRGNYCARHKSTPGNCYNFPRGYAGSKAAYLVSAKTTRGNCCVLFSRPECHGIAQVVKGNLTAGDMAAAGFEGHAHSMVCNLDEYCNPNRFEAAAA